MDIHLFIPRFYFDPLKKNKGEKDANDDNELYHLFSNAQCPSIILST